MHKQDNLHRLIRSMTKAEKRHFKILSVRNSKGEHNNYIMLFDAIDHQEVYDEEKLRKKFRKYRFSKQIAQTKYLLYQLILRSLRQLHDSRTVDIQLSSMLQTVEILYRRRLADQCFPILQKAKKIAEAFERLNACLRILDWEEQLLRSMPHKGRLANLQALITERQEVLQRMETETQYRLLLDQALHLNRFGHPTDDLSVSFEQMLQSPGLQKIHPESSFIAQLCYHEFHAQYHLSDGNFEKAFTYMAIIHALWQAHPEQQDLHREDHIRTMSQYIICGINARVVEADFEAIIDELQSLSPFSEQDKKRLFLMGAILDFIYHVADQQLEMAKRVLIVIEQLIQEQPDIVESYWTILLHYHIGIFHFLEGAYEESLYWIEKVQQAQENEVPSHVSSYCKLIGLMIRYELGAYEVLEYDIRKVYRYLKKRKQIGQLEGEVLNCVRRLLNVRHQRETIGIFSELHYSLRQLEAKKSQMYRATSNAIYHWVTPKLPDEEQIYRLN
ncbi:MAG: hypothetical protein AAFP19_04610 [Bacteroidota bacterium]